jgi:choline kinase
LIGKNLKFIFFCNFFYLKNNYFLDFFPTKRTVDGRLEVVVGDVVEEPLPEVRIQQHHGGQEQDGHGAAANDEALKLHAQV